MRPAPFDGARHSPRARPGGRVLLRQKLRSRILGREVSYSVYLPPGYETSPGDYPVLHLLHGAGDDDTAWLLKGDAGGVVEAGLRSGRSGPVILATPDAGMTFYLNHHRGEFEYEDFFVGEFVPHVERAYRVRPGRGHRSVAGLCMGGFGALLYSLKHPGLFANCCAMSAAVYSDDELRAMSERRFDFYYRTALGEVPEGADRVTDFWRANSVLRLLGAPETRGNATRFRLDCGRDDYLFPHHERLAAAMRAAGLSCRERTRGGGHDWGCWRAALPGALWAATGKLD